MTIDVVEIKRRLKALLNDNNMVNEYILNYGPAIDINKIKRIKEKKARSERISEEGEGKDPIFRISLRCPVCNQDNINAYELRAKSQQIRYNHFLVPVYKKALGYRTVDYTFLGVSVCHRCLFASPDKKDFIRFNPSGVGEIKSQLTHNIILMLQERTGQRLAQLKNVSDYRAYFSRPRSEDAAIASYRLAMTRANVEAWYELPNSSYKLGCYALRIAKIIRAGGGDNEELFREALAYFKEAFRTSNCPAEEIEMQVIYIIVALCIKIGDYKQAHSYIGVLFNLKKARKRQMKKNPQLDTLTIEKWQNMARDLWENRFKEDLFENE